MIYSPYKHDKGNVGFTLAPYPSKSTFSNQYLLNI
jgi:hypothetical protein